MKTLLKQGKEIDKLLLLGIWDIPPLPAWPWFSDLAKQHFYKLTGFKIRNFTYFKNGLHHEYFLLKDTRALEEYINNLTSKKQEKFIKKIVADYYVQAKKIQSLIDELKIVKIRRINEMIRFINKWIKLLPLAIMQIWFVLLLDMWYPFLNKKKEFKKIGARARDHSAHLYDDLKKEIIKIFRLIAKRLSIDDGDIDYFFPEEIIKALDKPVDLTLLARERKRLCVTTNIFGKYKIYQGEKAERLLERFSINGQRKKKLKLLNGLPTYPGKIRGKVRLVLRDKEFENFKENEILVTLQTMVKYLPVMKKAKAFLTEFGGITSHAAIMSREMKKPCIVGIQYLTSSLQDGDSVEVDADQGIVKIIK